jgi:hypothetical protein
MFMCCFPSHLFHSLSLSLSLSLFLNGEHWLIGEDDSPRLNLSTIPFSLVGEIVPTAQEGTSAGRLSPATMDSRKARSTPHLVRDVSCFVQSTLSQRFPCLSSESSKKNLAGVESHFTGKLRCRKAFDLPRTPSYYP